MLLTWGKNIIVFYKSLCKIYFILLGDISEKWEEAVNKQLKWQPTHFCKELPHPVNSGLPFLNGCKLCQKKTVKVESSRTILLSQIDHWKNATVWNLFCLSCAVSYYILLSLFVKEWTMDGWCNISIEVFKLQPLNCLELYQSSNPLALNMGNRKQKPLLILKKNGHLDLCLDF